MILEAITHIVKGNPKAAELSLSKGGWEGWLQCELWHYLNFDLSVSTEREAPYPGQHLKKCDIVSTEGDRPTWVEMKAHGVFVENRIPDILNGIGKDLIKLGLRPHGTIGQAFVVIPNALKDQVKDAIRKRWPGIFSESDLEFCMIFHAAE